MFDGQWFPKQRIQFEGGPNPVAQPDVSATLLVSRVIDSAHTSETYTTAVTFGDEAPDRVICVAIHAEDIAGTNGVSSVSFGGNAATIMSVSARSIATFAYLHLPTNPGTQNVAITFSGSVDRSAISIWRITNLVSTTPHHTPATDDTSSSGTGLSINVNVLKGGVALGAYSMNTSTGITWSGATEEYDGLGTANMGGGGAKYQATADETGRTLSTSHSSSSNRGIAAISWR